MQIRALIRRLPWLIPLLVGCGGDDAGGEGGTASTTGDETGATMTMTTAPTSGVDTTGVDTTGVDTTDSSTSSGDTTAGVDGAPQAVDDVVFTAQDTALAVAAADGVLVNDTDPDAGPLTVTAFDAVSTAGGRVVVAQDGGLDYTPVAGFWGPDQFGYTVEDEAGEAASATVTVYVAPVQVPLEDVAAGMGGFILDGEVAGDLAGYSVSGAGDVNGDGMDDLILGAWGAAPNGNDSGRSYVVFGKADTGAVELSAITAGMGGFVLDGASSSDQSGYSVSGAGDVNGDGMDDVIVGAWLVAGGGVSYVVFGKADTAAVELGTIAVGSGFSLSAIGAFAGSSVSDAGDVNGDGLDDVIVGAWGANPNGAYSGRSYVAFGGGMQLGFDVDGEAPMDESGFSVSGAGDVNGDGMDDLIIGAHRADPNGDLSGRSYVVFGKADTDTVELSAIAAGMGGFVLNGEAAFDYSGRSVSGAGDVNGDGMDDLIIGSPSSDRSHVVFGKADTAAVELGALGMGGFAVYGEGGVFLGRSVSGAGDVNGDGMDDVIVGAWGADPNGNASGQSYVVFGKADTTDVFVHDLQGTDGFVLDGEADGDFSGFSVSGAGDVNADGVDDLLVGAWRANPNGDNSGRSYVVFGVPTVEP